MKKLIAILLSVLLCAAVAAPAFAEEPLAGGWTVTEDATVTEEIKAAFDKAIEGMVGSLLEPVAVLATQVVAGANYCLLCRSTPVVPDAIPSYVLVYLYDGVDGTTEITSIADLDVAALSSVEEVAE